MEPTLKMPVRRRCEAGGCSAASSIGPGVIGPSRQPRRRNKGYSRVRRAVERIIGTLKCRYGLERCRYLGLRRNLNHLWLKGMCYNLRKMLVLQGAN
jgi:IS5 family transposase